MIRRITILHLLFFSLISTFSQAPFPIKYRPFTLPAGADFMPGRVIVKFADNYRNQLTPGQVLIPEIQTRLSWLKTTGVKKLFPQATPPTQPYDKFGNELVDLSLIYEVDFQSAYSVEDAVNLLMTHPGVVYAEPRYIHQPFYLPNDPLADTTNGKPGMWHLGQISALEAWDIQRGDTNVIIAIVDAGTYFKHDDLKNNLAKNHDDPIDGLDNDQDGYIDNYRGWDFGGDTYGGPPDNNPSIGNVHGLWVAGTACAEADNQLGVAGVSFNCRYLPIKAAADDSLNSISHGYEGIVYAADYGAQIINASWGSGLKSFFGQDVVRYATFNRSAVVIGAAGNSGTDRVYYPAAYREAISVASSRFGDEICCTLPGASGNTTFHHSVDVSAPGWRVASVRGEDQYWGWSGTSAAAPVVAGALGIVKARFPQMTGFQAAQRLRVMADDIYQVNPAYIEKLGYGRINMAKAVSTISRPSVRLTGFSTSDLDGDGKFLGGDTLVIKINFFNYLDPTQNLLVDISTSFPFVEVIEGNFLAGAIGMEKSFSSAQTFKIRLDEQIPPNYTFEIRIGYEDPGSNYLDYEYIDLRVNRSWIDITQNQLFTSLNSQGNFGFDDFGNNQQGIGVIYNLGTNALFEGGFLIGNSETQVSDRIRNSNSSRDDDFSVVESVRRLTSDSRADFVAKSVFNDQNAANSLGIEVTNHAYAFQNSPNHDFIIIEYIVENKGAQPLDSLYGGLFADWDISVFVDPVNFFPTTKNASDFDVKSKLVFVYDRIGLDPNYYGLSMISEKSFHAFATTNPSNNFSFDTQGKFQALSNSPNPQTATIGVNNAGEDIMHFISGGPFSLEPGEKDTLAFAIMGNKSLAGLKQSVDEAKLVYDCVVLGKGPVNEFYMSDSIAYIGKSIQLGDNNSSATTWHWDFGDGTQASTSNPQHTYIGTGYYKISLTVSDGTCTFTSSQWIQAVDPTNIDANLTDGKIALYPNPGSEFMTIELESSYLGELDLQLLDMSGREVWMKKLTKGSQTLSEKLDISQVPAGLYLLRVNGKAFRDYRKVVIR